MREIFAGLWRIVLAVALVGAALSLSPSFGSHAVDLAAKAFVCVTMYVATLLLLWKLCGSPEGAERYMVRKLLEGWQALSGAARARR